MSWSPAKIIRPATSSSPRDCWSMTNNILTFQPNDGRRPALPKQFARRRKLSDRAFHLQLDQPLQLDAVFHGELADEIVDETVNAQTHRLRLSEATLLHVENLIRADLADTGFVLDGIAGAAHGNSRICVGSRRRVDEKRVAFGVVFAMLQMLRHVDQAAVSSATFADGN